MAERKLSDSDLARLRDCYAEGWSLSDLAAEFDVTPQYVGTIVRGDARPAIGLDVTSTAAEAIAELLAATELDAAGAALGAVAVSLAGRLDACCSSDTASGAQAAARCASALVDVIARLRGDLPREPDQLDALQARHAARRLAAAAAHARTSGGRARG